MKLSYLAVLLLCLQPEHAFAYVDPGSGYLVWQIVVAGVVGSLFFVKRIGLALQGVVKKLRKSEPPVPTHGPSAHKKIS